MRGKNRIGFSTLIGIFVAIVSVLGSTVQAQQAPLVSESSEWVEIGGVTLRLGMAQDSVIHNLGEYYNLQEIGAATAAGSSWTAEAKAGPPHVAVARLTFLGGRLSSVYKYWADGGEPDTGAGFASTLYGAVTKFEQESKARCELTTGNSQQPLDESKTMVVTCGGRQKYLSISFASPGTDKQSVSLAEVLKYPSDVMAVLQEFTTTGASGNVTSSSSPATLSEEGRVEKPAAKSPGSHGKSAENVRWVPKDVGRAVPEVMPGVACPLADVLSKAGKRIEELVDNVNRFTANEAVTHQVADPSGQLRRPEIRNFDYVVSIAKTASGFMNVDEFRNGSPSQDEFPDHLATVGTPSLVLLFHPQHVKNSIMTCEGLGRWNGQPAWQVRFEERSQNPSPISVVVMQGRAYGLRLRGRAWILATSYQVARLETDLADEIPAIRLYLQHQNIEYRPVHFTEGGELWLPSSTELYVDFHGHRFYRQHRFTDFHIFLVGVTTTTDNPKE